MSDDIYPVVFPKDLMFGACVSDYQHFGKTVCDLPPTEGAMHIDRFKEDFDLVKKLNLDCLRTGVEWSRVEPVAGAYSAQAFGFYKEYFDGLRSRNLRNMVTLHHFTNPPWIHEVGGWLSRVTAKAFVKYAKRVVEELGDRIDNILLFNEPGIYALMAYHQGENGLPPKEKNFGKLRAALENIVGAMVESSDAIRQAGFKGRFGFPSAAIAVKPESNYSLKARALCHQACSTLFYDVLDETISSVDFVGVDYYTVNYINGSGKVAFSEINPEALTQIILELWWRYRKPLAVVENGFPTRNDDLKTRYLIDHLLAVYKAIEAGVPVFSYNWWSLLHGYEWGGYGYKPFFGLIDFDQNYSRMVTNTAGTYSQVASTRYLSVERQAENLKVNYPKNLRDWRLDADKIPANP
jgi:beta-glucosidase